MWRVLFVNPDQPAVAGKDLEARVGGHGAVDGHESTRNVLLCHGFLCEGLCVRCDEAVEPHLAATPSRSVL